MEFNCIIEELHVCIVVTCISHCFVGLRLPGKGEYIKLVRPTTIGRGFSSGGHHHSSDQVARSKHVKIEAGPYPIPGASSV